MTLKSRQQSQLLVFKIQINPKPDTFNILLFQRYTALFYRKLDLTDFSLLYVWLRFNLFVIDTLLHFFKHISFKFCCCSTTFSKYLNWFFFNFLTRSPSIFSVNLFLFNWNPFLFTLKFMHIHLICGCVFFNFIQK